MLPVILHISKFNPDSVTICFFLKRFLNNNSPWLLWGLFILVLVCIPGDRLPEVPDLISIFEPDKLIHLFLFLIFTWLMMGGLAKQERYLLTGHKLAFICLLTGTIFGGGSELLQHFFIPGRIASIPDFIANEAGCFAGWGLFLWRRKRLEKVNQ